MKIPMNYQIRHLNKDTESILNNPPSPQQRKPGMTARHQFLTVPPRPQVRTQRGALTKPVTANPASLPGTLSLGVTPGAVMEKSLEGKNRRG